MIINRCWRCMEDMGTSRVCPRCGFDPERNEALTYALKPNTILHGKYLIGNVLGQGGFGITYIGFDLALELKVAIKEYFPFNQASRNIHTSNNLFWQNSMDQTQLRHSGFNTFLAEARKMAKINFVPEIVSVRDTFEENKTAYIVMDYVPGMTLKEHIRKNGTMSYEDCLDLLQPLIQGIEKVHSQGIIHRDISPANLMLSPDGRVHLLDLGAAKDMKKSTGKSELVATKGYSPMEQYTNSAHTGPWSDVYSMTASIYYCLFGKTPPAAIDRVEKDTLNLKEGAKKPLTARQIAVLSKGMAVNKADRYQSIEDLLNALLAAKKKKKNKAAMVVGAVAAAAAVVALAVMLFIQKPWNPTVEQLGMGSPFLEKNLVVADDNYKYYVDKSRNLVCITYDEEDQVYYVNTGEIVYGQNDSIDGDGFAGLAASKNHVYATCYGGLNRTDYLIRLNHDGSEPEELFEFNMDHTTPQYVRLSNGKEYFYYLQDSGEEEDNYHLTLYRYDVKKDRAEQIIDEEMIWYTVYDKYVYYILWDAQSSSGTLKRASLAGDNRQVLDEDHNFVDGFVEDGRLYLLQRTTASGDFSVGLIQVDAEGKPVDEGRGLFSLDWSNATWTVGGGWMYYWEKDTEELRRVRLDGTGDGVILEGYSYYNLSYHDGELYFQDGYTDEDDNFHGTDVYLVSSDGKNPISCTVRSSSLLTTASGLEYQIEDGKANILGYVGEEADVLIPSEIGGFAVNPEVDWNSFNYGSANPQELRIYVPIDPSELNYSKSSDGMIIEGYNGDGTGKYVSIPGVIEGEPVVAVGEKAFQNAGFEGIYLQNNIQGIGAEAFDGCANLKYAFFPDTLIAIESYAFYGCSLDGQKLQLPEGLTHLGMGVFFHCSPASVYLPSTLSSLDDGFLAGCGGEYIVSPEHPELRSSDGMIISKDGTVFYACSHDRTGSFTVPNGVVTIYNGAFYGAQVNKVIVPDSVTVIGARAFLHCANLETIYLHKGVKEIGERAFQNTGLTEITVPYSSKRAADAFGEGLVVKYFQ